MDYEKAYSIFGDIQKTGLTDLLDSLYGSAVRYADSCRLEIVTTG